MRACLPACLSVVLSRQVSTIFRYADLEAVFTHITKAAALQAFTDPLVTVREAVTQQCVEALFQYRLTCASSSPPGQLILPESLKLMPLYSLALLKSDVRAGPLLAHIPVSTLHVSHRCPLPASLTGAAAQPPRGRAGARHA